MAFVLVGSGGTAISGTSSSTLDLTTTADLSLANSRFCVLAVSSDNISTSDGATTDHTSVTGGTGTWTKIGEYTNANGAAAAGVTTSLWFFLPSGANATGTVFTITFASAVVDKAAQIRRFTWDTAKGVRAANTPVGFGVDATTGFGSGALSGLPSQEYLFVSGLGKEANTTTALTPSSGWGTWSVARSRNNAAAVASWGEHLISTATGATSSPTLAVSGDTASLIAALEEYTLGGGGAINGSTAPTFTTAGNLTGTGALSGSSAPTFTTAATLIGGAPVTGAVTVSFTTAATGQATAAASGSATVAFTATGAITGAGLLSGVIAPTFTATASLAGSGALAGSSAGTFTTAGNIAGSGALSGAVSVAFDASGNLAGSGALGGSADAAFALSGALSGLAAGGAITGSVSLGLSVSGQISSKFSVWRAARGVSSGQFQRDAVSHGVRRGATGSRNNRGAVSRR